MNPTGSGFTLTDDPATPRTDATVPFRDIIPQASHPRIKGIGSHSAQSWCDSRKAIPEPAWLINRLDQKNLKDDPYAGFSADGKPDPGIFDYEQDEGAPVEDAVKAVKELLEGITDSEREAVSCGDVREDERFRMWSNPELYVNPGGIRLDESSPHTQTLVHDVLKASLSPEGYAKALGCTWTNAFLGQLVGGQKVLNEHSYNFRLFLPKSFNSDAGTATTKRLMIEPWGWSFFGHHLCLNVVFVGKRMIVGPTFMGAEPDRIDEGPHAGTRLFTQEEIRGLELMRSLSEENRTTAQINVDMKEGLAEDRWNPFDERHLGGARQDNRIVPFGKSSSTWRTPPPLAHESLLPIAEGLPISQMTGNQREEIWAIVRAFNCYLPSKALAARMKRLETMQDKTYFAWIGGFGLGDPYYFRIHSPMTFCEFDFHCGIFLTNTSPAKCHIHTINRLPNCEDYGKALIAQWQRENEE